MQQLLVMWGSLGLKRQFLATAATVGVFVAVLLLGRMAASPDPALLYSGLEPDTAGRIIAALDQSDIGYTVEGNAIFVASGERDRIRLTLAEQGLPDDGPSGYELLDGLPGFGTTSQMFDATLWRAREGELARTLLAWPQIRSARVHIANVQARPFAQPSSPTASVTLKLSGGLLSASQQRAIRMLVASAVAGLSAEDVSVIDSDRGLLTAGLDAVAGDATEDRRADELRANVERLLAARLGQGNVVVEVTVDTVRESETLFEKRLDPASRVAISSDTEETSGSSNDTGSAGVTVASNLPEGDASAGKSSSSSSNTLTRERINYEVSETTREIVKHPGRVLRLSVAVIVNSAALVGGFQESVAESRTAEIQALRELVESAVGFNPERGDVITIKEMPFPEPGNLGTLAEATEATFLKDNLLVLIQTGTLAIVALGLGLLVLRPALVQKPVIQIAANAEQDPADSPSGTFTDQSAAQTAILMNDPVTQLRQLIADRQDDTVEVLRNWIEAGEERA